MVSRASIFNSVWTILYNLINSNVTDPGGKERWVFPSFPENSITTNSDKLMKTDYPIIIIPEVKASEDIITYTGSMIDFPFSIEVYSVSRKKEANKGGAEVSDNISDDIFETIQGNLSTFQSNGIFHTKLIGRDTGIFTRDGVTVFFSILNFTCQWFNTRG